MLAFEGEREDRASEWLLSSLLPLDFLERTYYGWRLGALGGHALRVAAYSYVISEAYGLSQITCERYRLAGAFHDIGKLLLPERLLDKPSSLENSERREIEAHTLKGYKLLIGSGDKQLQEAATVALHHHECVDGSGYPNGLVGDAIALSARIVSVADVFDALSSDRPYRAALTEEESVKWISQRAGVCFDKAVVDAFMFGRHSYPDLLPRLHWFTDHAEERVVGFERLDEDLPDIWNLTS